MFKHTFTHAHPYVYISSVRTNPYPLSNRIIDKRAKVGKYSITCGPLRAIYTYIFITACGPLKNKRVMSGRRNLCPGRVSVPCFTSDTCHKL